MNFKRGDVAYLIVNGKKHYFAVCSTEPNGEIRVTCVNDESYCFPVEKLKKEIHPLVAVCKNCNSTPFIGKHPNKKWRVYCVCDGPGNWYETKAQAVLKWNFGVVNEQKVLIYGT